MAIFPVPDPVLFLFEAAYFSIPAKTKIKEGDEHGDSSQTDFPVDTRDDDDRDNGGESSGDKVDTKVADDTSDAIGTPAHLAHKFPR